MSTRKVARVLRGGAFLSGTRDLRSSDRDMFEPTFEYRGFGFRCARGVRRQLPVDP
jgi:formylglycine-generating enzyme required for sulfatase activity